MCIRDRFTTLATGLFLAGLGQASLFKLDVVQWSAGLDGFEKLGQGSLLGIPMPIIVFALACIAMAILLNQTRIGAYIYAVSYTHLDVYKRQDYGRAYRAFVAKQKPVFEGN